MDRQTLTQYGMIIVSVIIIVVIMALATPFGNFITGAIQNIGIAEKETSDKLLSDESIKEHSEDMYELFDATNVLLPGLYQHGQVMEDATPQEMIDKSYVVINDDGKISGGTNVGKIQGDYIMPKNITQIADSAFSGCHKLVLVKVNDGTTTVGKSAFANCTSLQTFIAGDDIEKIDTGAFQSCTSLKTVYLNSSIKYIKNNAFVNCPSLEEIYYNGTKVDFLDVLQKAAIDNEIWYNNETLKRIVCTDGIITAL